MARILKREQLSELVWRLRIDAPRIARKRKAGQFIILRPTADGERIPLTIANAQDNWIEVIFQVVGLGTTLLSQLKEGDDIPDLAGPLGRATHIEKFGRCVCIGGGVGVAPLYPIVNSLHSAGNDVTTIIGARNQGLLILENEMKASSNRLLIATDDGSYGTKGFVTTILESLLSAGEKFDFGVVIGPAMMMKFTSKILVNAKIPTVASLNPIMVDGTGMCGGCRVTVGGETKFACVDGPEFDAAKIDFDEMINRLSSYKTFEKDSLATHVCKLEGAS